MKAVSSVALDTGTSRLGGNKVYRKRLKDPTSVPRCLDEELKLADGIAHRLRDWLGVWFGGSDNLIRGWQALAGRLYTPDLPGILGNGAVAGELARGGYVPDHHPCPLSWVLQAKRELWVHSASGVPTLCLIPSRDAKAQPAPSPGPLTLYRALTFSWHLI